MKMQRLKKAFSLILGAVMLMTCSAGFAIPASATDYPVQNGTGTREAQFVTEETGYRVKINAPFTGFAYNNPTWNTNTASCRASIYKWEGNYRDTVSAAPIASRKFENMQDNARNWVTFEEQPAGEYLFLISEPIGNVGVWVNTDPVDPYGYLYKFGQEQRGDPELHIRFSGNVDNPFGVCEPSVGPIDGNHTAPPEAEIPSDSLLVTHEVMPDTWVFTDGLGRVSLTNAEVGDPREDKTVAMFYWTWHVNFKTSGAFNNNDFLKEHPDAIRDYDHPAWNEVDGCALFWNQPLWGYYANDDAWVVRRQGELLANAGVDAVLTDNTNGAFTWQSAYRAVMDTWSDARTDGVNTPKLSFMLPFAGGADTAKQLRSLYSDFYRNGEYHDQWFYWDGKPVIMAHGTSSGLDRSNNLDKEILNFFCFRPGHAGYTNANPSRGTWGWLSIYPQPYYCATKEQERHQSPEMVTVGVAMNHSYELDMIAPMNGQSIMGRSYTHDYENRYAVEGDEASKWGHNFAEQFEYALRADPRMVFVTGWNEWTAGRHKSWPEGLASAVENAMPDQCNDEFSRDIEPTKGALKDHYYYQLVNYVRKYKGAHPIPTPTEKATIDVTSDSAQWSTVGPYYAAYIGNTEDRDAVGYANIRYTEYSGRNDIKGARVARDDDFVYFYVECVEDITPYTDPLWMVLYIDSDQENQGWETFDYVLNKTSPTAEKATLERFTGNGYETEVVGEVDYTVNGPYMQVKVPKAMLNLSGYDFTVNFAWTDNVHDESDAAPVGEIDYKYTTFSGDIMDFYLSGDVAPGGRFKFSYISTSENAGVSSDAEETTDSPSSDLPTDDPLHEQTAPAPSGGCTSAAGLGAAALLSAMAAAVARKKKED